MESSKELKEAYVVDKELKENFLAALEIMYDEIVTLHCTVECLTQMMADAGQELDALNDSLNSKIDIVIENNPAIAALKESIDELIKKL